MVEGLHPIPLQPQQPGLGFHGHHFEPQQVAGVAQEAPAQRSDAAGTAGDEPPEGGRSPGARRQTQGPAVGGQGPVEISQAAARLRLQHAAVGIDLAHPLQAAEIEHHPTGQGHTLAIVARAGAPQRQGHRLVGTGRRHRHHLIHPGGQHHQLGHATSQQGGEHRRIVVEVGGKAGEVSGIAEQLHAGTTPFQRHRHGGHGLRRWGLGQRGQAVGGHGGGWWRPSAWRRAEPIEPGAGGGRLRGGKPAAIPKHPALGRPLEQLAPT